jgi:hypothetical protein
MGIIAGVGVLFGTVVQATSTDRCDGEDQIFPTTRPRQFRLTLKQTGARRRLIWKFLQPVPPLVTRRWTLDLDVEFDEAVERGGLSVEARDRRHHHQQQMALGLPDQCA